MGLSFIQLPVSPLLIVVGIAGDPATPDSIENRPSGQGADENSSTSQPGHQPGKNTPEHSKTSFESVDSRQRGNGCRLPSRQAANHSE